MARTKMKIVGLGNRMQGVSKKMVSRMTFSPFPSFTKTSIRPAIRPQLPTSPVT